MSDGGLAVGVAGSVYCGTGNSCSSGICCDFSVMNPPLYCGGACYEGRTFTCDGPEDCTAGDECCGNNSGTSGCQQVGTCGNATYPGVLCHQDPDCSGTTPRCCELTSTTSLPMGFGMCMAAGSC